MTNIAPTADQIMEGVKLILIEHMGLEAHRVIPTASFLDDLEADSLDLIELVMAAEERWGIEINDTDAEACKTVQDMVDLVTKLVADETRVP